MPRQNAKRSRLTRNAPEKRGSKYAGTSLTYSLDKAFYEALVAIAERRGITIGAIVAQVNADRAGGSLSSALRLFILLDTQRQVIAAHALVAVAATLAPTDIDAWQDPGENYPADETDREAVS